MRKSRYLTLLFGILAIAGLSDCSRESSVKEDVSLKNNHSRVFAQNTPFEDPKAFADSMANTAFNEADSLADTLTVTINDTVHLMGILPRNVEKIYRFQWNLPKSDGKDTVILGNNATPMAWAFAKAGVYYPKFIAFDGNNASDTAGTDTKRTYINVIDTKPNLWVPKDTLWTSNQGSVTFPILASDSFGTITKILVDLDASGKDSAKVWEYEKRSKGDSLYLTIKNDSKYIDSLGNQKIYVIVVDDDKNETKDSVNLHFNRLPKLKILYPQDGARHNSEEPFAFYYEGIDDDNPQDLRYFIYAQNGKNGQPPAKAFDSEDLIAENLIMPVCDFWVERNGESRNAITLVNDPSKELTGRIYWYMYVTDGYDVVYMERIKTDDGSSRPWNFYIGDVTVEMGTVSGVATYQGRTNHEGINVELTNGIKTYIGITDAKGNYTVKVGAGVYTATAYSIYNEYTEESQDTILVTSGESVVIESMTLKDTVKPILVTREIDTIAVRNLKQTIYARDLGSRLDSVTVTLDGKVQNLNCNTSDQDAIYNCQLTVEDMTDGAHLFVYTAKDHAGNKKSITDTIYVFATTMVANVDGAKKSRIKDGEELTFTAEIQNAWPELTKADSVEWTYVVEQKTVTKKAGIDPLNNTATLVLSYNELKSIQNIEENKDYSITAKFVVNKEANIALFDSLKFGILSNNPTIIFTEPASAVSVTKNDVIKFKYLAYMGKQSNSITVTWDPLTHLSQGISDPSKASVTDTKDIEKTVDLAFDDFGTYKIVVNVKDDQNDVSKDSVTVTVFSDKPTIKASTNESSNEYKINAKVDVMINASDKFGTVNEIRWGCTTGTLPVDNDESKVFANPSNEVENFKVTVNLSKKPEENKCIFKAIDDDGESSTDTLIFITLLDPPTVKLATKLDTVKVKSVQTIKANATDKLGYIAKYEYFCDLDKKKLASPTWVEMESNTVSVQMPDTPTSYYCLVQVTDDDGNKALDSATYVTLVGLPTVKAIQAQAYKTVTINDVVEFNANAQDSLVGSTQGTIVKYEWGCGVLPTEISFKESSRKTNITMPSLPQDVYSCVVRVTDDDGNQAMDTVETKVILAPPTVKVTNKSITVRYNVNMVLNANASDNNGVSSDPGEIVKREWSCGKGTEITKNWKVVSQYDTVWKSPAQVDGAYYCVARVTDNDGLTATDTTSVQFTNAQPGIWVKEDSIKVLAGASFDLSAEINDAWQGVEWFQWECIDQSTKKSLEPDGKAIKYDYKLNGGNMNVGRDGSYTKDNLFCVVTAKESSTQESFTDTTFIQVLKEKDLPTGVITAADTAYIWSGEDNLNAEAIYFYTKEWGGMNSKIGELGDKNDRAFYWSFGTNNSFYMGNSDGSLDTSKKEFNEAFIRKTYEGASTTIRLDFRDMTKGTLTQEFYDLHKAKEVSRTVYFSKAWKNLAKDTVIENVGEQITAPAMAIVNGAPYTAYTTGAKTVKVQKLGEGTKSQIGSLITAADIVTKVELATNGTDLYLGVLDTNKNYSVYLYSSGKFVQQGSSIASASSPKLLYNPSTSKPLVLYIKTTDKQPYKAEFGSSWSSSSIALPNETTKFKEISAAFVASGTYKGNLVVVAVDTAYNAYYSLYNSKYNEKKKSEKFASNTSAITVATTTSKVYLGFQNRDVEQYGPFVHEGTLGESSIQWNKSGDAFSKPVFEGFMAHSLSIATYGNEVYLAIDDNGRANNSQSHVFKLKDNKWLFYGENQLPYFSTIFYNTTRNGKKNNYYLRGYGPQLAIDGSGKIYLSMLGREAGSEKPNKYNGPIVMKYVADNWEVH